MGWQGVVAFAGVYSVLLSQGGGAVIRSLSPPLSQPFSDGGWRPQARPYQALPTALESCASLLRKTISELSATYYTSVPPHSCWALVK